MESKRIVRFLIAIFAVLSVLFFSLYRYEKKNQRVLSEDFVQSAVLNLGFHGVVIDRDTVVRQLPDERVYVFEYPNEKEYSDYVVKAFEESLGNVIATSSLETPDGLSVTFYDKNNKDVKKGRLLFPNGDFGFSYSVDGNDVFSENVILYNSETTIDGKKKKIIDSLVKNMVVGKDMDYRISGSTQSDDYVIISIVQTVNDVDINDMFVNFCFDGDELVHINGCWIAEKPKVAYHEKLIDGINVLYRLDFDNVSEVLSEKNVYIVKKGEGNQCFLVPGWEIVCVDADDKVFKEYFDVLSI